MINPANATFVATTTMEMKKMEKSKAIDYATTLALMAVPVIIGLQPQIMAIIPAQYTILATIIFGVLSQYAANQRITEATE